MVRIQDLTQEIKTIAILERVEAVHVAANCFRRGYGTTCTALSAEEQFKREKRATSWLARRGGNWANGSKIPQTVYAASDRDFGQYARVQTWEEADQGDAASRDGGRDNFFRGLERGEREEHEAA
jgi:hypothetical protein